ncbi:hypothetical protein GLOTRDRAFT_134979 [Gloeophyllum trabeum ATCC 11539]|uniref:ZZ-type domain-containing protein n=1 Tax=Gloeophyllum trabeum (strain ATCC 11539 / FP-39264 / Madison 617) TaxID=670483 RepID=S7RZ43_GLOTA|nr:uncharacterized protein GLOTRDRAFT_134979 [Gloeophyllum trabeum ATCC 11539]EPQ60265.1 hypothetical protein GLOTRDRAFT_134979 [Gloeophyllum trabeum ATCC 11539]
MFTVKATYRSQTRKFTFDQSLFPSYQQLFHQLYRVFPISQSYYLSKLLFAPQPAFPNSRILLSKEVHNAEQYERAIQQYNGRPLPGALLRFTVFDDTPHKPAVGKGIGVSSQSGSAPEGRAANDIWLTGPEESITVTPSIRVSPLTQCHSARSESRSPMNLEDWDMELHRLITYDEGSATGTYVPSPQPSISSLGPQQPQHMPGLQHERMRASPPSSSASRTPRASPPRSTFNESMPQRDVDPLPVIQDLFTNFVRDFDRIMERSFGERWRERTQSPQIPPAPRGAPPSSVVDGANGIPPPPPPLFDGIASNVAMSGIPPPPILDTSRPPQSAGSSPPTAQSRDTAFSMPGAFVDPAVVLGLARPEPQSSHIPPPPPPPQPHWNSYYSPSWNVPPPPPLPTFPGSFESHSSHHASSEPPRVRVVSPPPSPPSPMTPSVVSQAPSSVNSNARVGIASQNGSTRNAQETVIHLDVVCDSCNEIVVGVRHKCLDCPNYDLCTPCMESGSAELHNPFHEFFDVTEPGGMYVHNVFSGNGERTAAPPVETRTRPAAAVPPAEPVRHNATCDLCDSRIVGERYKCLDCPDFDACERCFSITPEQHPSHGFVRVKDSKDLILRHDASATEVHTARCDSCTQVIVGVRYKCMHPACPDYDLCSRCEAMPIPVHPSNHPMLKLKGSNDVVPRVNSYAEDRQEQERLERMQRILRAREEELEQREDAVNLRSDALNLRNDELEEREREIAAIDHALGERQRELDERFNILEGREKIVEEKEEVFERREDYLMTREGAVDQEIEARLEAMEDKENDLQVRAETLEDQLRDLEARREELDAEEITLEGRQRSLEDWANNLECWESRLEETSALLDRREMELTEKERDLEDERVPPYVPAARAESPWRRYAQDLLPLNLPQVPTHVPNIQVEPPSPSLIDIDRVPARPVAVAMSASPQTWPTPEEIDDIIRRSETTYPEIETRDLHHDGHSTESEDVMMPGTLPMFAQRTNNANSTVSSGTPSAMSALSSLPLAPSNVGSDMYSELWPAVASELRHLLQPSTEAVPDEGSLPIEHTVSEGEGLRDPTPMPGSHTNEDIVDVYSPPLAKEPLLARPNEQLAPPEILSRLASSLAGLLAARPISQPSATVPDAEPTDPFADELATEPEEHRFADELATQPEEHVESRAETPALPPLRATCVSENNIPDGQIFPPGAEFVKSWNVINDGEREWPESTVLVFVAGDRMGSGADTAKFKVGSVPAGETVDVWTGELKAPEHPGKYVSYWRLSDGQGNQFGQSLWIDISVAEVDTSSGSESLAASSVIMPHAVGEAPMRAGQTTTEAPTVQARSLTLPSTASGETLSDVISVGSSASLISHPGSPSSAHGSMDEWEDTRGSVTPPLAPTVGERDMEYIVLYESSDSGRD